jgi:hypothetical protein
MRLTNRGYFLLGLLGTIILMTFAFNFARLIAGISIFIGAY